MNDGCRSGGDDDSNPSHPLKVSARAGGDTTFVLSSWDKGISPYDFEMPYGRADARDVTHTVVDRTLVRVGGTVHFHHIGHAWAPLTGLAARNRSAAVSGVRSRCGSASISKPTMNLRTLSDLNSGG